MANLSKWLDLRKVVKDASSGANTKWDTLTKTKDIKKLNYGFQLPAFTMENVTTFGVPVICRQYNFSLPEQFTILNYQDIMNALSPLNDPTVLFTLAIRYRIGSEVFRYKFNATDGQKVYAPMYSGQVIKANFCLEVWCRSGNDGLEITVENALDRGFVSSVLFEPEDPEDTDNQVLPVSTADGHTHLSLGQLFNALPSNNPAVFNVVGPFLDN